VVWTLWDVVYFYVCALMFACALVVAACFMLQQQLIGAVQCMHS
jgi:hypothetical protein